MNDTDQFFTEEDAPAGESPKAAKTPEQKQQASTRGAIKPPTFGMACAIAVVALVLGLAIGYFAGMFVASNSSRTGMVESTSTSTTSSDSSDSSTSELPSGHPDISQYLNEDGTVNTEAIASMSTTSASE